MRSAPPPQDVIEQIHGAGRQVAALCGSAKQALAHQTLEGVGDEQDGRGGGEGEQAGAGGVALNGGRAAAG